MGANKTKKKTDLVVRPVPIPPGAQHPGPPRGEGILPEHEHTLAIIAPKGSGKTTLLVNLLEFYKGYFHTITIISPTLQSDEKWDRIRAMPLLAENKALKKFLEKRQSAENAIVGKKQVVDDPPFDPHVPADHFLTTYDEDELQQMMDDQLEMIAQIQRLGGTKHLANRWLLVLDDMVGSSLFSGRRSNPFKRFVTSHRHLSASSWQVTQAFKELPKTARINYTGLITFRVPNQKELEALYEEFPNGMDRSTWMDAYDYCTEGDGFDFMYLNVKRPKRLRLMKNFQQYVFIDKE